MSQLEKIIPVRSEYVILGDWIEREGLGKTRMPTWRLEGGPSLNVALGKIVSKRPEILRQLTELAQLEDGWLDGAGIAPSSEGLVRLEKVFGQHSTLDVPHLYPTPRGGIQAEWSIGSVEITLEIDLSSLSGMWHELDMATDEDAFERPVNCTLTDDWDWISARLKTIKAERLKEG